MAVIRWEDPPDRAEYDWGAIVAELRERPGQWAAVAEYKNANTSGQVAQDLRAGRIRAALPAGSVEATARKVDGQYLVYARYVGESS